MRFLTPMQALRQIRLFAQKTVFIQTIMSKGGSLSEAKSLYEDHVKLQVVFCTNCNERNIPGARKCTNCGCAKLSTVGRGKSPPNKLKKKGKK